jgi:hypothetical protein
MVRAQAADNEPHRRAIEAIADNAIASFVFMAKCKAPIVAQMIQHAVCSGRTAPESRKLTFR